MLLQKHEYGIAFPLQESESRLPAPSPLDIVGQVPHQLAAPSPFDVLSKDTKPELIKPTTEKPIDKTEVVSNLDKDSKPSNYDRPLSGFIIGSQSNDPKNTSFSGNDDNNDEEEDDEEQPLSTFMSSYGSFGGAVSNVYNGTEDGDASEESSEESISSDKTNKFDSSMPTSASNFMNALLG